MDNPEELGGFIVEVARRAGDRAMAARRTLGGTGVHAKHGNSFDLVTDIDRATEELITSELRRKYPGCAIFGEEAGRFAGGELEFVIDPIDGTVSFVHDLPTWSVSIGATFRGERVAGVVYSPRLGECFSAVAGAGAKLNGETIRVSTRSTLEESLLGTGFSCARARIRPDNYDYLPPLARLTRGIRRSGSAALDLCYVAAGRYDAFFDFLLQPYDVAAGALIALEAGARITALDGSQFWPERGTLASNGLIHDLILPYYADCPHWKK